MVFPATFGPWNTDDSVLLRLSTGDNARNAASTSPAKMSDCTTPEAMRFFATLPPDSCHDSRFMAHFIPNSDPGSISFLNLRTMLQSQPCLHCGNRESLKSHGFLRGASRVLKGIRLYCSNHNTNSGCGRTFSIHFEGHIPHTSHSATQAAKVIESQCQPPGSQEKPGFREIYENVCSRSTAYRWLSRFQNCHEHIRARLHFIDGPDKTDTGTNLFRTWRHLQKVFQGEACVFSAFQRELQSDLFGCQRRGEPIYDWVLFRWLARFLAATRNGTKPRIRNALTGHSPVDSFVNSG